MEAFSAKNAELSKVPSFQPGGGYNIALHAIPTDGKSTVFIFCFHGSFNFIFTNPHGNDIRHE